MSKNPKAILNQELLREADITFLEGAWTTHAARDLLGGINHHAAAIMCETELLRRELLGEVIMPLNLGFIYPSDLRKAV